jgi:arylsulfatase A-like enzyme
MSDLTHTLSSRRRFLSAGAGALLAARQTARAQRSNQRLNLIFLLTDDQRWDTLGCMGNPIIRTPNVDQMAASGVIFSNNFVTTSICMTSRASFFTGLYARSHKINSFQQSFTADQYSRIYPVVLRAAGYRTGFIGKWGVGNVMPRERFDYFEGFPGQGQYFVKQNGKTIHLTELMGNQSIEFLRGSSPDKPFCLSVSFKAPHVQDQDPRQFLYDPAHADWYKDVKIPIPETADPRYISMLPVEVQRSENRRRWAVRFGTPELYQESVKSYYRLITEVDIVVGRIREELKRMNADDNTVIIYTGDNGFYLAEHGLAGKWLMHEESLRTPLVVYDPRLPAAQRGKRRSEMALNIDIAPTLLDCAGVKAPAMQGRNLYPLIEGKSVPWRKEWFYEHLFDNRGWIPPTEGIRNERWKYTRYIDTHPLFEELFDLENDLHEERNLAKDPRQRAKLEEMRERWKLWRSRLEAWRPGDTWRDPA